MDTEDDVPTLKAADILPSGLILLPANMHLIHPEFKPTKSPNMWIVPRSNEDEDV